MSSANEISMWDKHHVSDGAARAASVAFSVQWDANKSARRSILEAYAKTSGKNEESWYEDYAEYTCRDGSKVSGHAEDFERRELMLKQPEHFPIQVKYSSLIEILGDIARIAYEKDEISKGDLNWMQSELKNQFMGRDFKRLNLATKRVSECINVARRCVPASGYEELEEGTAFDMLPRGQGVYIPMHRNPNDYCAGDKYDMAAATLEHKPEFDMHPTPNFIFPLGTWQWQDMLFDWVLDASLDVSDILSDANLSLALFFDSSYDDVPFWFKCVYVGLLALSITLEIAVAANSALAIKTNSTAGNKDILDKIGRMHGCFEKAKAAGKFIFLNYLGPPAMVMHPHDTFMAVDHGGRNEDVRENRCAVQTCPVRFKFRQVEGLLNRLPRFIIEDGLLFGLGLILFFYYGTATTASIGSIFFATINFFRGWSKLFKYVSIARLRRRNLAEWRNVSLPGRRGRAEKALEEFDTNCFIRLICIGTDSGFTPIPSGFTPMN